jgi:hypothetical protein
MNFLSRIMLAATLVHPTFAQAARKKAVASPAVQKEFENFIGKFRVALKANDSAAVADMTRLPYMNDSAIGDAAQFREKVYKRDFTSKNRACTQHSKAVYDRDGDNNDSFSIFCPKDYIFVFTRTPAGFLFTDVAVND